MESSVFRQCHDIIWEAGKPLVKRAQEAGVVRPDTNVTEIVKMVSGISQIKWAEPDQLDKILLLALDGLRYSPKP
jgi:hypothetical protein